MVSGPALFFSLFNNLAIFIALTAVYGYFLKYFEQSGSLKKQTVVGVFFGIFAIGCMYAKIPVYEGVIVDQRNAIIVLSGLTGGLFSAIISGVMAGSYRIYLGGGGVLAGVIGVCLAAIAGIILKKLFGRLDTFPKAGFGALLATVIILPGFLFVEDIHTGFQLMQSMALPYGVAIFLGISLVGLLLSRQKDLFDIEKAFRKREEQYREVVEGTSDLITYVNNKSQFIYVNRMSEDIFGISPESILTMSAFDFVHPDDREETEKLFKESISKRLSSRVIENRQVNLQTGAVHNMLWSVNFHYDDQGQPLGASAIAHDITDRKQAEERIHIFNELINKSNDAIFVIDPKTARILDVNMKACFDLGYAKEELLTMKAFDIEVSVLSEATWEEHTEKIRKESFLLVEGQHKKKDGSRLPMEVSITISNYKNREYIIAVARDLTARKVLETKLNQAHKMEAIGRLAGGVAHDLNNLLTPIIGYGEILMADIDGSEQAKDKLGHIVKAGMGARDLVRQLLAFSRKQMLEYKAMDINEVLDQFVNLIRRTIREDIAIDIVKESYIEPVMADIGQIEQVIMNLIVNAADAMPDGGTITIKTSLTELEDHFEFVRPEAMTGKYVVLAVSDTGVGMDQETQLQIFEPFFTTKGELGTGLGLATVYGIIKQHNGNISVYSKPGNGSTFKIYLPVSKRADIDEPAGSGASTTLQGTETILLVEDNDEVRNTVFDILEHQGYTVLVANNGIDALEIMSSQGSRVQMLLTDVVMPGMNGKELYATLSRDYPGLKVLYMSGYTDNIIVHHGVLEDGMQFIQKPFTNQAIAAKVRGVLDA